MLLPQNTTINAVEQQTKLQPQACWPVAHAAHVYALGMMAAPHVLRKVVWPAGNVATAGAGGGSGLHMKPSTHVVFGLMYVWAEWIPVQTGSGRIHMFPMKLWACRASEGFVGVFGFARCCRLGEWAV